jgi:hypothetical protein
VQAKEKINKIKIETKKKKKKTRIPHFPFERWYQQPLGLLFLFLFFFLNIQMRDKNMPHAYECNPRAGELEIHTPTRWWQIEAWKAATISWVAREDNGQARCDNPFLFFVFFF